jgi:glycosyltransferase involved in cell wall biosynthesis
MRVALLSPFEETVPPKKYGGTELVVSGIAEELIKLGHDVTLFASGDSITKTRLIPGVDKAIRVMKEAYNPATRIALNLEGIAKSLAYITQHEFDIVHNHIGWQVLLFKDIIKPPILTTLHGSLDKNLDPKDFYQNEFYMYQRYKNMNYVSISQSQRRHGPDLNYIDTIHHGIDVESFSFNSKPKNYLGFLGRIHYQKGPEFAIEIARKTGHELIIAAKIAPEDEQYFTQKIKPLIDGKQIKYIGEVNHRQKVKFLRNAKAVLSPIQWDEPFGLTNIESMACGTPVIALGRGALNEIIEDGEVGYLCRSVKKMIARVSDIDKINRLDCRRYVEQNFTNRIEAENYVKAYRKILNSL